MSKVPAFLRGLLIAVLSLILAFNLYTIFMRAAMKEPMPTVFGYASAIITSGSMGDAVKLDDYIITHRESSYAVGDIVTYVSKNDTLITHRIVAITEDGYVTQGDSNNVADAAIRAEQVRGKVVFRIPKVGAFVDFFRSPLGALCLVALGFLLLVVMPYRHRKKTGQVRDSKGGDTDGEKNTEK